MAGGYLQISDLSYNIVSYDGEIHDTHGPKVDISGTSAVSLFGFELLEEPWYGYELDHLSVTYSGRTFSFTNQDAGDANYGITYTWTVLSMESLGTDGNMHVENTDGKEFDVYIQKPLPGEEEFYNLEQQYQDFIDNL